MLTHLSLFSGIGGIDLAAEWAGFRNICFVEIDKFCQQVLRKHWPDVPIIEDVHDVTKERIEEIMADSSSSPKGDDGQNKRQAHRKGHTPSDTGVSSGTKEKVMAHAEQQRLLQRSGGECGEQPRYRQGLSEGRGVDEGGSRVTTHSPITLVTGGFPCQPVSVAGKRRGKEDDRWLWPEMLRVISEVRPTWVVAENVAGLAGLDLSDGVLDLEGETLETTDFDEAVLDAILGGIINDLEKEGYEVLDPFVIPACAVNAPHRRDRIFIVAWNTEGNGSNKVRGFREGQNADTRGICEDVAHAGAEGLSNRDARTNRARTHIQLTREDSRRDGSQWAVEPNVGRVAHGIPRRVDRLRALGNAVVPQQIYPILKAIAKIERVKHGG